MLFYNEDWLHHIWTRHEAGIEISEESLKDYVSVFKGSQITDFIMNLNATISTSESEVFDTYADKYLVKEEAGEAVDYSGTFAEAAYKVREKKLDIYKVWIEEVKKMGINPWISIRMNDCHGSYLKTDIRKSSFITNHPEYHIAAHRERIGYFDQCLDFSHDEVRNTLLAYIDEQLGRYDVYGIEFDFMRESFFVQFGKEHTGIPIMDKFMKEVFAVVKKYEEKYGHPIKRSMILSTEPNLTLERGMDIFGFIDELDFIIIIPRWETVDTDMPIELWKRLLRGTNVKLACGQQLLFKPYRGYKPVITTVEMAYGQAAANLSRGADLVYLYNYMDLAKYEGELGPWEYEACIRNDENRPDIFKNIGKLDTLMKKERSHVVTYSDFWRYDIPDCSVLPIEYTGGYTEFEQIKIPVGKVPEGAKVQLILGIDHETELAPEDMFVYVNATRCELIEKTKINERVYENDCYVFTIGGELYDVMYAEVKITKKCRLEYVEIRVIPQ